MAAAASGCDEKKGRCDGLGRPASAAAATRHSAEWRARQRRGGEDTIRTERTHAAAHVQCEWSPRASVRGMREKMDTQKKGTSRPAKRNSSQSFFCCCCGCCCLVSAAHESEVFRSHMSGCDDRWSLLMIGGAAVAFGWLDCRAQCASASLALRPRRGRCALIDSADAHMTMLMECVAGFAWL